MLTVSLTTSKPEFSRLILDVERGERVLITRRGRPVARLVPHSADKTVDPQWAASYERMMAQFEEGASLGRLRILREDLYSR